MALALLIVAFVIVRLIEAPSGGVVITGVTQTMELIVTPEL